MTKESKSALVATRRFPEFIGRTLREIQFDDATAESTIRNGDRLLPASVMGVTKAEGIVPMEERIIASDIARYKIVQKDWFAYNPMRLNIGSIARWHGEADILVSPDYVVFRCLDDPDSGVHPAYLDHFRQSAAWDAFVSEGGDGGVRVRIYYKDLARLRLVLPPRAEQQKIADCLTSLDEVIVTQLRKVEALTVYKRGLMQQLFPREGETLPRLRFSEFRDGPKWSAVTLNQVVEIASGQVDPTLTPYCDLPHVGGDNIESQSGNILDVKTARELRLRSGKYPFDQRDILYSKIRPALNKVASPDFPGICSADIYPIRPSRRELSREYLLHLLRSGEFLVYATKHSERSKIPKINRETLLAYGARIPSVVEQQRIAACLSSLDVMIGAASQKLDSLRAHKKGLMQQLFPSPEEAP